MDRRSRTPDGQNVPDVQLAVAKRRGWISARPVAVRTLASAVTLGSVAPRGARAPVAFRIASAGDVHAISSVLLYPFLGIACGLVSAAYSRLYLAALGLRERIPGPRWLMPGSAARSPA